jgi:hypothetical protein
VAQGVGPEFKLQYSQEKKERIKIKEMNILNLIKTLPV